jgi:hypothetical protein
MKVIRMVGQLKNAFVVAAATVALVLPLAALAQSSSAQVTYKTSMEETTPMAPGGYYQGTLKLTVASNGVIQGWYFPDDTGPAITVSGSDVKGTYWLSFGNGNFRIDASAQPDGKLVGSGERVLPPSRTFPRTFSFIATPLSG